MLKLGIVIDAAAEVPQAVLDDPRVRLLPISVQIEDGVVIDKREPSVTSDFNKQFLNLRVAEISRSVPPDEAQIRQFFLDNISLHFDHVFGLFVTSTRSPLFKSALNAASQVISDSLPPRQAKGIKGPLFVECYDSLNMSSGYGVQVQEALRQFDTDPSTANLRTQFADLGRKAYTYLAPNQLDFLLTRAKARGDSSVGFLSGAAAKMLGVLPILRCHNGDTAAVDKVRGATNAQQTVLDLARRELQRGLLAPFINLSYSGPMEEVLAMPNYTSLVQEAQIKGVQVSLQETSPTMSVNFGPRALAVGFIANAHEPKL
jgi:DegV family protein with EDD domain